MASSDVSSVTKYFSTAAEGFSTTLGSTISAGASSVGLNATSGLTNGNVFVGIIEPGATGQQVFTGTVDVSGSQITNVVWVRGTNVGHAAGVTIVDYVSGAAHNMMTAGILKQHTQAGAHTGITTDTISTTSNATVGGALAVTGATTLTGAVGGAGYDAKTLVNSYKFSVYRNAAWNTGNNAVAVVPFDTKTYDTGTNIDVVTNKGRFTAPIAGFYRFSTAVNVTGATTRVLTGIAKNGTELFRFSDTGTVAAAAGVWGGSTTLQLAANDYAEIIEYTPSAVTGGAGTGPIQTWFTGELVSAT